MGMVMDCPVRDIHGINETGFPIWVKGITLATPVMTGPGRVGFAGQQIYHGDIVIANADGVVTNDKVAVMIENGRLLFTDDLKQPNNQKWPVD